MEGNIDSKKKNAMAPACCDIYQEGENVILEMEMPGVAKDDLEIKVDGNLLIIHGIKDIQEPEGEYNLREINSNDYYHEFTIDDTIDRNKISASMKNGIAKLTLSMKESEKPRKITVTAD
jgi:HSP20 family protein